MYLIILKFLQYLQSGIFFRKIHLSLRRQNINAKGNKI